MREDVRLRRGPSPAHERQRPPCRGRGVESRAAPAPVAQLRFTRTAAPPPLPARDQDSVPPDFVGERFEARCAGHQLGDVGIPDLDAIDLTMQDGFLPRPAWLIVRGIGTLLGIHRHCVAMRYALANARIRVPMGIEAGGPRSASSFGRVDAQQPSKPAPDDWPWTFDLPGREASPRARDAPL